MSYLTVISLAEAKVYLRVDDTLTEDDNSITMMINAALGFVEKETGVLVYDRDKTYLMVDGERRVYDFPINSVVSPDAADMDIDQQISYTTYCYGTDTSNLVLNVGYATPSDIPQDLIAVAYEIIDLLYYSHETGKTIKKDLSQLSREMLTKHKRFIL
jgi:hypothetical protein